MMNAMILFLISSLIIFTPIAFGSVELWAFSLMELGILLIIILWAIQWLLRPALRRVQDNPEPHMVQGELKTRQSAFRTLSGPEGSLSRRPQSAWITVLLSLFLLLVLFQMISLPSEIIKVLSPQTYELRNSLSTFDSQLLTLNSKFSISFVPFLTRIEFLKWLTLSGFFLFLLSWKYFDQRAIRKLILVVLCVGVFESLYGMFEFFSGHKHILHLKMDHLISSVTGTFINRNAFAGYLLMVIPLSTGYLFHRETHQGDLSLGWRHRFSSLDGKTLLIAFGIIVMILGLLFSASRMGIVSLLLSFTLISLLFRDPQRGRRFSKAVVLIFGLALLWAVWIGLDAVISRFFTTSESFEDRWTIWVNTFQIIKDYLLFGTGLGTFIQVFPMYRSFHIRGLVTHAENDFLQLASEVGLIGAGLLLALFIYLFYKAITRLRFLSHRDPERYIAMGGLIGILALMFHSLVERNIQIPANAFLYAFIWGLVLRAGHAERGSNSTKPGGYQVKETK
ncbi:MAG: O-antigen ligase family protein [Deltaproteobacteria bacterium]|nr:O-antigen ligase family protein [Deltaproteobacteria bacterium]MBM4350230.1 O-antigen ligase family protein [Deltaproteobacteria bacterium]